MRVVHCSVMLAILAGFAVVPRVAFAQTGALSDSLAETVMDLSGVPVPLAPPPVVVTIPETSPEPGGPILIPSRVIDFLEPTGVSQSAISDRLIIGPVGQQYELSVRSDDDPGGLPPRAGATIIPASALEHFQPFRIEAVSDGDPSSNGVSDTLTITVGYYGPGTGMVIKGTIPEPTPEGPTEPPLTLTIPPTLFDVEELTMTAGPALIVSDYVDIPQPIVVTFLSSDDPTAYEPLPPHGFIMEDIIHGGGVVYALDFRSDVEVPEPASTALLGVAIFAISLFGHRRRVS